MLGKSRELIPCLSAMMRSGCQDAERIQLHCSVALCNSLSVFLHKDDVLAMIENETVQDLIVITVLRVNDVHTKQVLSKALFNLLTMKEVRPELTKAGVPMAMLRLTRVENAELNLLAMKMLNNYSCERRVRHMFIEMKVVRVMIDQCTAPAGGVAIKRTCGGTLANLSFVPELIDVAWARASSSASSDRGRGRARTRAPTTRPSTTARPCCTTWARPSTAATR